MGQVRWVGLGGGVLTVGSEKTTMNDDGYIVVHRLVATSLSATWNQGSVSEKGKGDAVGACRL